MTTSCDHQLTRIHQIKQRNGVLEEVLEWEGNCDQTARRQDWRNWLLHLNGPEHLQGIVIIMII